jgi:copper transport protein
MARRSAVLALTLALAVGAAGVWTPGAGAHARLVHVSPADGAALAAAPRQVQLQFNEAISPRFRVVRLIDGRGHVVVGAVVRPGSDAHRLVLDLPRLRRGAYQVSWEVLAQDDGHVTGGAAVFGVATRPLAASRAGAAPGAAVAPVAASLQWLDVSLLCALIGAIGMAGLLARLRFRRPAGPELVDRPRRVLLRTAAGVAALAFVVGLALLARQVHQLRTTVEPQTGVGDVLAVRWGALWLAREALLGAVVVVALAAARTRAPRGLAAAAAALLIGVAVVHALGSHAAAGPHRGLAVAVAAAHVLAAGLWIGGVAAFALALAVAGGGRRALAHACRTPFGRAARAALALLVVTGLLAAGAQVASIDALLTTDYGSTLLIKAALVALAAGLGLGNAVLLRRGASPRLLTVEAAAGSGVLLAAAVLSASPPAKGPEFAPPRAVLSPLLVRQAGDLLVTTAVRPNRPGPNVVSVLAVSSRRPAPAAVRRVAVRLHPTGGDAAATVALAPIGAGRFAGGVDLATEGGWRATVTLRRGGERVAVPVTWSVEPPDPARPVVHSARRLAPLLDRAALAVTLVLLATAAASLLTARRRRRTGHLPVAPLRTTSEARMPLP